MLKGLEAYGSDESDTESSIQPESKLTTEEKTSASKSLLSLPPPVNSAKSKPRRAVFTIAKPRKSSASDEEEDEEQRISKKPKLEPKTGTRTSSLLAMLPPPSKSAIPAHSKPPEIKHATTTSQEFPDEDKIPRTGKNPNGTPLIPVQTLLKSNTKAKGNSPGSSVDFFSLGSNNVSAKQTSLTPASISASISSAPAIPTFEPPEPTPQDPYPGYYQLPSGQWAAYDQEYYMKCYNSWAADFQKPEKGFEDVEYEGAVQIDVQAQLDLARKEQEDRKTLTKDAGGGPSAPRMNIKAAKAGSLARTRHQLSTLLTEAYENREALEERIAQAKRNRKESGNKYGF